MPYKNKEDQKTYKKSDAGKAVQKRWYEKNKKNIREYQKEYHKKYIRQLKQDMLDAYGNICGCCKESKFEFLSIDHINGNGRSHRQSIHSTNIYKWLKKNNYPKEFRILCMNCNFAIGIYGACPHQGV